MVLANHADVQPSTNREKEKQMTGQNLTLQLTTEGKTINGQVTALVKKAKSITHQMRFLMANIIMHAVQHGNVTPANTLCDELHELGGFRVSAMREWFEEHGPFVWNQKDKTFNLDSAKAKRLKKRLDRLGVKKYAIPLLANPFDMKKEKVYQGFNFKTKLKALIKQAGTIRADSEKANSELTDLDGLELVSSFVARMDYGLINDNETDTDTKADDNTEVAADTIAA